MNLLLAKPAELRGDGRLIVTDRRLRHLREVLKSDRGDRIRVGILGGRIGAGVIEDITARSATLSLTLDRDPPAPLALTVVLALPRPTMLRRILRSCAEVGVKDIHLINSFRVEKSFWQSPLLREEALETYLVSGLEQAGDTVLPSVTLHPRFRPFAEDVLPGLCGERTAFLAHPGACAAYPATPPSPALVVIGPEGGLIPFELALVEAAGAQPVQLGERVLRVETALQAVLGRHLLPLH